MLAVVPALLLLAGGDAPAQGLSFAQPPPSEVPTLKRTDKAPDKAKDQRVAPAEQAPRKDAAPDQARRPAPDPKKLRCARPPCSA